MSISAIVILVGIVFVAFLIVLLAMAVGVLFGRRAISGSCGGLGNQTDAQGNIRCSICENPAEACRELKSKQDQPVESGKEASL